MILAIQTGQWPFTIAIHSIFGVPGEKALKNNRLSNLELTNDFQLSISRSIGIIVSIERFQDVYLEDVWRGIYKPASWHLTNLGKNPCMGGKQLWKKNMKTANEFFHAFFPERCLLRTMDFLCFFSVPSPTEGAHWAVACRIVPMTPRMGMTSWTSLEGGKGSIAPS